jgi:hypothetical protein
VLFCFVLEKYVFGVELGLYSMLAKKRKKRCPSSRFSDSRGHSISLLGYEVSDEKLTCLIHYHHLKVLGIGFKHLFERFFVLKHIGIILPFFLISKSNKQK